MSVRSKSEIEDEATRWVVRMHSDQVTLEDESGFAAWLAEAEAHRTAYKRLGSLWGGVGALRDKPEAVAALAALRASVTSAPNPARRYLLAASIVGGAVIAAGGGWLTWRSWPDEDRYETAVGEQRRVLLADGSAVTLNTNSALRSQFDDQERRLWLDRGQAFFAVARDTEHPFRVFVGEDEVRAVGTAFDIRREGARARVTLKEGVVAVYRGASMEVLHAKDIQATPAVVLEAGQQVVVAPTEELRIVMVDAQRIGAWRFGQMVLEADPLSSAVAEINRYNVRQIVIADPSLNDMAINGVFQTGRPEAFVEALTAAFPVDVKAEDERAIYLRQRESQ